VDQVIAPYHPGWGESADEPSFTDLHDYVMHYLELFDVLGLEKFNLAGLSLGGYLAAKFASEHGHRIKKLALIAPAGVVDPDHPMLDIIAVPAEQVPALLVSDFEILKKRLPEKPTIDFMAARYRESTTVARLLWERPADPKFMRYLHRIRMPTLVIWGDEDKIIPVQQSQIWRRLIPNAEIMIFKGAGHLVHLERPEAVAAVAGFLS
jgi:pimeloyl-ACP methyl ester carboxylesterase